MQTAIKFGALKGLSNEEKRAKLHQALNLEYAKAQMGIDLGGPAAIAASKSVIPFDRLKRAANDPNMEAIKGFLVKELESRFGVKYATPDSNPELTAIANEFQQFYHSNMPEMDLGYQLLFDYIDLRGEQHDHFDILDTSGGITFTQREPGERTQIRRAISESKTTVDVLEFADGIGLLDRWLQFNQFWNVDEVIAEFLTQAFEKKAEHHYGLLTALGAGINESFATDDVKTFNNAAATIQRNLRGKGINTRNGFVIVCEPEKRGRIEKMLTAQRGSPMVDEGTASEPIVHNVEAIVSTTHIPAGHSGYYLVKPGGKLKRADWKDLTVESDRDIRASATNWVGHNQYNAAIGDSDQVRRVQYA